MTTTPSPDIDCLRFVERGLGGCGVYVHVRVSHAERVRGVVVCTYTLGRESEGGCGVTYTCVCLMQRE